MPNKTEANKFEQIFTPTSLTDVMLELLTQYHQEPIDEFLEPCAGDGRIVEAIQSVYPNTPILSFDIEPKADYIKQADFLKLKMDYKPNRVTMMNPPFTKATLFIKKALTFSDTLITIAAMNTFLNLDYDKYDVKYIRIYKKAKFLDGKTYEICLIVIKNRK